MGSEESGSDIVPGSVPGNGSRVHLAALPAPLEHGGSGRVLYEFIRIPDAAGFGDDTEPGIVGGLHFIADLTLPYGRVIHDDLAS
jgi:acetoacetate decarboxylase